MSPVAGIVALAGLFALFGVVERYFGRPRRSCGSCTLDARDPNSCSTCPIYEAKHD
jgi:hypothetical protein